MIGILAEKPSQARNFAKALGGMQGTYAGEAYMITNARGHLFEFADPASQVSDDLKPQYKSWKVENLPWDETKFAWKRKKGKDVASLLKTIKQVMSQCDEVCIATDDDPTGEGELIAWEIFDELKIGRGKKFSRMYFVDESVAEVQKAFKNRKPIASMEQDMDFVKARYRSQWDFLSTLRLRARTLITSATQRPFPPQRNTWIRTWSQAISPTRARKHLQWALHFPILASRRISSWIHFGLRSRRRAALTAMR